jgi:hypothetical protein
VDFASLAAGLITQQAYWVHAMPVAIKDGCRHRMMFHRLRHRPLTTITIPHPLPILIIFTIKDIYFDIFSDTKIV